MLAGSLDKNPDIAVTSGQLVITKADDNVIRH